MEDVDDGGEEVAHDDAGRVGLVAAAGEPEGLRAAYHAPRRDDAADGVRVRFESDSRIFTDSSEELLISEIVKLIEDLQPADMAHRKWKEAKLQPGTAGPGNRLGCCLVSFHFLWAIQCPQAVVHILDYLTNIGAHTKVNDTQDAD